MSEKKFHITSIDGVPLEHKPEPTLEELVETKVKKAQHPFDNQDFINYVAVNFPGSAESLKSAATLRPALSNNPDEMEKWEAVQISKRKQRFDYEQDLGYLVRLLYEESFSVNQNPGSNYTPMKGGAPGLTPGGLVSHFGFVGSINGVTIEKVIAQGLKGNTLKEEMAVRDDKQAMDLLDIVNYSTHSRDESWMAPSSYRLREILSKKNDPAEYETIGYRLVKMLANNPQMTEHVQDRELLEKFKINSDRQVPRYTFIHAAWQTLSRKVFAPHGPYYKGENDPELKEAAELLLYFRTHPEMQIFYKYLSPSGYINEKRE